MTSKSYRMWAGVLTVLASVGYFLGLTLPITTFAIKFPFFQQSDTYSLPTAIKTLYEEKEFVLFGILVAFTFVFPVMKLFSIFMAVFAGWTDKTSPVFRFLRATGRWSMLDVFVVALLVVLLRVQAMMGEFSMVAHAGIYCFGASVILAIWAGHWAETANRLRGQAHP